MQNGACCWFFPARGMGCGRKQDCSIGNHHQSSRSHVTPNRPLVHLPRKQHGARPRNSSNKSFSPRVPKQVKPKCFGSSCAGNSGKFRPQLPGHPKEKYRPGKWERPNLSQPIWAVVLSCFPSYGSLAHTELGEQSRKQGFDLCPGRTV